MVYVQQVSGPLGQIHLASDGQNLIGLWLEGQKYFKATLKEEPVEQNLEIFDTTKRWLDLYFQGKEPDFMPPLSTCGTPFQEKVWKLLRQIPYGSTTTYGQIAAMLHCPKGFQAVGGAVGHNPISILIPCHRVLGSDGRLTGYAGGVDKKVRLLELEGLRLGHQLV